MNRIKLVSVEYIPLPMLWIFFWRVASFIASDNLCTLPKFNIAPEKLPKPNRKGLSSFTTFSSGVNSLLNFRRGGVIFQDFAWIPTLLCFNPQNLPRHVWHNMWMRSETWIDPWQLVGVGWWVVRLVVCYANLTKELYMRHICLRNRQRNTKQRLGYIVLSWWRPKQLQPNNASQTPNTYMYGFIFTCKYMFLYVFFSSFLHSFLHSRVTLNLNTTLSRFKCTCSTTQSTSMRYTTLRHQIESSRA